MNVEPLTAAMRAAAATHGLYTHACLEVSIVDHWSQWRLTTTTPHTHRVHSIPVTDEVADEVEQLRAAMADPDRGTWFTAIITITPDQPTETTFDFDTRPTWLSPRDPHVEAAAFARDLQRFPRTLEHTPDWLTGLLGLAAQPPAPARRVRPYWRNPDDPNTGDRAERSTIAAPPVEEWWYDIDQPRRRHRAPRRRPEVA